MRRSLSIIILALAQLSLSFDLSGYKKQYQAAVGDPFQNAATLFVTNIIEYLAVTPVPTTTDAASQMIRYLIAQSHRFADSLNNAATSSGVLKQQLDKESHKESASVDQQIAANGQQLQENSAQIQQTSKRVADMQNQVNAASKNDLKHIKKCMTTVLTKKFSCDASLLEKLVARCTSANVGNAANCISNHAQQDLANCQQHLTSLQNQLTQLQANLTNLNQQQTSLQGAKAKLESKKAQQQARDDLNSVSTKIRTVLVQVTWSGKSQALIDVVKNLIDTENVITPLMAIADQITGYTASAYDINYLNILKQKIQTNLPLVQQKLPQFASLPPSA